MLKVFYIVCGFAIGYVLVMDIISRVQLHKDKPKGTKETFPQKIIRLSEHKFFTSFHPKEGSSFYKTLLDVVKTSSIPWLTVPRLNTMSIIFGLVGSVVYVLYTVSNITTTKMNYDKLLKVAEEMQDNSLAQVTYFNTTMLAMLLVFFALGYFAPWLYFKVMKFRNDNLTRQEAVMMKTYAIMMLKTDKNVKFVIEVMYKRAKMFKESLGQLWSEYSLNPVLALQNAMDNTESEDFKKILNTLYKSVKFDRESAVEYLERDREMSQQMAKIRNKKRNQTKDTISTILMMGPLLMGIVVAGYPLMLLALKYIGTTPV